MKMSTPNEGERRAHLLANVVEASLTPSIRLVVDRCLLRHLHASLLTDSLDSLPLLALVQQRPYVDRRVWKRKDEALEVCSTGGGDLMVSRILER